MIFIDFTATESYLKKLNYGIGYSNTFASILVHQYNPFNAAYKQEVSSMEVELYADKLRDSYG